MVVRVLEHVGGRVRLSSSDGGGYSYRCSRGLFGTASRLALIGTCS
jgi:hypothetical protein